MWLQRQITLRAKPRGFHLVGDEISDALPELADIRAGILHLHLMHTSAGLTLTENASPEVRTDLAAWIDRVVPEGAEHWRHTLEGDDDMPAHVKSMLTGVSLILPIAAGGLALGTWQGVCLCEFRDRGGARRLAATIHGEATAGPGRMVDA
jgi:secondary thiamine-phosphate synthase enzyme